MRVVYFGTPQFAAPTLAALLTSRHTVVGVVTQPDRARGRGQHVTFAPVKQLAVTHGLPVLQPERLRTPEAIEAIAALGADLGVVAAYGKLLPQALLDVPPLGMVNVHASLLPRWRGAAPIHRAIQAGDAATGVTIMRVVLALDAGPMLSRVELPITDDIKSDALEVLLADAGARLLIETLDRMDAGPAVETPQDETGVTYAARLDRRDGQIDWTRPARDIHNQIRGLHPWPLASVVWRGKRLILRTSTLAVAPTDAAARGGAPGCIVALGEAMHVQTGTAPLAITEVQLEGRRPQSAREFINGARPAVGDVFEPVALS
ncbi:MAG: methionyl-tRNA formyltransferase [Acidobacteria bacterium]|nr:methionyl-tRNA formyltransferase [Acidobacteriota bacterium]MBP8272955.1 methionyl-tRNA formyltransferase [Acidobacteriota bacterium]